MRIARTQGAVGQLITPMLRALLIERLKITFHTQDRLCSFGQRAITFVRRSAPSLASAITWCVSKSLRDIVADNRHPESGPPSSLITYLLHRFQTSPYSGDAAVRIGPVSGRAVSQCLEFDCNSG